MPDKPNRYGAKGIYNETGVHCCCHMVPLTDICDGCEACRSTMCKASLVGVDAVRMNPLNDDGAGDALDEADTAELEENDEFAEDVTDFGWALVQLRDGKKVCREGWNGRGMWLILVKAEDWNNDIDRDLGGDLGKDCLPWIGMKTAQGGFVPWLASQTDILAEDWEIVE